MKTWQVTQPIKPNVNFADIMSEQVALSLQEQDYPENTVQPDEIDEDFLLAQQLQAQFNEEITESVTTVDDDLIIAQILQANEEEEKRRNKSKNQDTTAFEKVRTISPGDDDDDDFSFATQSQIHSSDWYEAMKLEKKLGKFDEEKQASITKHDPLLRALKNSEALTELEGAGDLAGGKLLVSPSVGFSLRSFEKKQRKQRNDIAHQNKLKAAKEKSSNTIDSQDESDSNSD